MMMGDMTDAAYRVLARADELAAFTEEPGRITRPLATPALAQAMARLRDWMDEAGLETRSDALGNLAGRRGPAGLIIGSHLDSVADAGRYDGILGVLVGLAVVEELDVPVELVAFADEEGLRFQSTFLGSRAFVGRLEPGELELRDPDGITLREAIGADAVDPLYDGTARAYFEVHIEQGPVLEAEDLPLGVVTAIAGQTRFNLAFKGHAGHAGTTPMALRRDALAAAAEFVLAAERAAREEPALVATVGELDIPRGACNVIPGHVHATLAIRPQDDAVRERAIAALQDEAAEIGARRGVSVGWSLIAEHGATPCTPALVERLAQAGGETRVAVPELPRGAGRGAGPPAFLARNPQLFLRRARGVFPPPPPAPGAG